MSAHRYKKPIKKIEVYRADHARVWRVATCKSKATHSPASRCASRMHGGRSFWARWAQARYYQGASVLARKT